MFEPVSPSFVFFFFAFRFFFPVLCVCTHSRHAPKHQPCAPPPSPGQKMKLPCHCEVSTTMTACTHIVCITRACPPTASAHGLWSARDQPHPSTHKETAGVSGMMPMYRLAVSPFFISFFFSLFISSFFHFIFFFPVLCVCTPSRHTSEHHLRAPPLSLGQKPKWPCCRKVLTTMTTTTCTHIIRITHPCPSHDFDMRLTTLFDAERDYRHRTASSIKPTTLYVSLPSLFFFLFSFSLSHARRDGPAQKCRNARECRCVIDLVSSFSVSVSFFLFGCIQYL